MQLARTRRPALLLALLVSAPASLFAQDPLRADFLKLDTHRRELTNFNIETVRGAAWSPQRDRLFALNTHGSRLVMHDDGDGLADGMWPTVQNPVAIGISQRSDVDFDVVVLGGATHALVVHDSLTGEVVDMTTLPSEPGDLVITPDGRAFVSSMGENVVVELDLTTLETLRTYAIPSQRPRFLSLVPSEEVELGYRVFVAPFLSGNNTALDGTTNPSRVRTLPLDDPSTPEVLEGLPDEDLFELVPPPNGVGVGSVNAVVKGLGHLILEHTFNPVSGQYCVLSIVPENGDPARQNEPALRGDFAENGLTLLDLPDQGQAPVIAPLHIDLDDAVTGGTKTYTTDTSCSFPFAVAVDPQSGYIFVASSTSDRLVLVSPAGDRVWQRDLPDGSIPRDIVLDRQSNSLTVYLWGTNELFVLALSHLTGPGITLELGLDPTPASTAAGRELWYDADNSQNGRSSCNVCHPGGASDFLGWAISGEPEDRKDVMVSQSLLSIVDTAPYHWRGERRQLSDFNKAFDVLLGGAELDDDEFDELRDFVFSLQAPRNPGESLLRVVDDGLTGDGISAVQGQLDFNNLDTLGGFTCAECHSQPEGTNGGISADTVSFVPSNRQLDVAHLRQLFNREVGSVEVDQLGSLPRTGWGLTHDGDIFDVFDFIRPGGFAITPDQRDDLTAFVRQFDQGVAPVAQLGWLLDEAHLEEASDAIVDLLEPQAQAEWLDLVVFGRLQDAGGQAVFARWLYDPSSATFLANDASIKLTGRPAGTAQLADFQAQASAGTGSNVFLGVPLGNGVRVALDPDNDGLDDGEELAWVPATDPDNPDTDGDGDRDGHEVANGGDPADPAVGSNDTTPPQVLPGFPAFLDASTITAEYELRFSEPVTYSIDYSRPGEATLTSARLHPVVADTIVLNDLRASSMEILSGGTLLVPRTESTYDLVLSMTDLAGNSTTVSVLHRPTADDHLEPALEPNSSGAVPGGLPLTMIVEALSMQSSTSGDKLTATIDATVAAMHEGLNAGAFPGAFPQAGHVVVAQILRDTGSGWDIVPASEITIPVGAQGGKASGYLLEGISAGGGTTPAPLGDIVFTPATDNAGSATVTFELSGLASGQLVRFNVIGLYVEAGPPQGGLPVFTEGSTAAWQMPNTEDDPGGDPTASRRGVTVSF